MAAKMPVWALVLLLCLSPAHGEEVKRRFRQSCDTVRDFAIPWLKRSGFRFGNDAYRCQSAGSEYAFGIGDSDCYDFVAGKRLRNA